MGATLSLRERYLMKGQSAALTSAHLTLPRHSKESLAISIIELRGQAFSLAAENQHNSTIRVQRRIPQRLCCFGRKEKRIAELWQLLLKRIPIRPHLEVHMFPVIQSGAPNLAFVE